MSRAPVTCTALATWRGVDAACILAILGALLLALSGCSGGAGGGTQDTGAQFNGRWFSNQRTYGGITGTGIGDVRLERSADITDGQTVRWISPGTMQELYRERIERRIVPLFGDQPRWCLVDTTGKVTYLLSLQQEGNEMIISEPNADGVGYGFRRGFITLAEPASFPGVAN